MLSERYRQETVKAVGEELSLAAGHRMTRLRVELAPGDTTAEVEGTYGMDDAGTVVVEGLDMPVMQYTGKTATTLTGLVRDDAETQTAPAGAVVVDASGSFSALDEARAETHLRLATGIALDRLGASYGIERPGVWMDDETYSDLVRTVIYLDNGTWWAIWRACNVFTRPFQVTGITNVTGQTITDGSAPFNEAMIGRYVEITDIEGVVHTHRIVDATTTTLTLSAFNGPYWVGANYASDDYAWAVLGFLIHTDPDVDGTMPCEIVVQVFSNDLLPPCHFVPSFTEDEYAAVTPPAMTDPGPPAVDLESDSSKDGHASGIVLEDETVASSTVDPGLPFTIGGGGVASLDILLTDLVMEGITVRSEVWPV